MPAYAAGFVDRQAVSLSGEKFEPVIASITVGTWLFEGIGFELELGTGVREDNVAALEIGTESQVSIGLRLESKPVNGVAAYVLLAATGVTLNSRFTSGNAADRNHDFSGFRGVFGLTFPLSSRSVIDAAVSHSEFDDDFNINTFRIGARYVLNDVRPRRRGGWLR